MHSESLWGTLDPESVATQTVTRMWESLGRPGVEPKAWLGPAQLQERALRVHWLSRFTSQP